MAKNDREYPCNPLFTYFEGTVALTAVPMEFNYGTLSKVSLSCERYFEISPESNWTSFEIKVSFASDPGLSQHIYLVPQTFDKNHSVLDWKHQISIVKLENGNIVTDLFIASFQGKNQHEENFTHPSTETLRIFNTFALEISYGKFTWLMNKVKYVSKNSSQYFKSLPLTSRARFKLFIKIEFVREKFEKNYTEDCPTLFIDKFMFKRSTEAMEQNLPEQLTKVDFPYYLLCDSIKNNLKLIRTRFSENSGSLVYYITPLIIGLLILAISLVLAIRKMRDQRQRIIQAQFSSDHNDMDGKFENIYEDLTDHTYAMVKETEQDYESIK